MILETRHLTKRFSSFTAVNDVNITIKRRSVFGLLGVNGAGKTTILCMLTGLIHPSKGEISICGHDLKKEPGTIRSLIGLLPQDAILPQNITMNDLLNYYAAFKGLFGLARSNQVTSIIEGLHLEHYKHRKVGQLSHGLQKLVAIAQAFLGKPEIVFLDEPLAGLDPHYRTVVRDFIKSFKGTLFISTHLLEEVELLCTDVGILHNGSLTVQESIKKLKREENYLVINIENISKSLVAFVRSIKGVSTVKVEDRVLHIMTEKDLSMTILRKLIAKKAVITAMEKGMSTEDIFLESITEE